jgi:hypothetical protein
MPRSCSLSGTAGCSSSPPDLPNTDETVVGIMVVIAQRTRDALAVARNGSPSGAEQLIQQNAQA